jgi:S-adenosylmethionine hydrolase
VLYVDRFGNVALNLERDDLEDVELAPGTRLSVELPSGQHDAVFARTFGDAQAGDLILYEDSYRKIAIAVSRGDASQLLGVRPGDELVVGRLLREF